MKKIFALLGAAALVAAVTSPVLAQPAGYGVITSPTDTNLVLSPFVADGANYVVSEYYGAPGGGLAINGLTFTNNEARFGGNPYTNGTETVSFPGSNPDAANLDYIAENNTYSATLNASVPTVAGHNYVLQLFFHDNAWSDLGHRRFSVYAGQGTNVSAATDVLYANMDLVGLGAPINSAGMVVLGYFVSNAVPGTSIQVLLTTANGGANNALINALTLLDVTASTVPPVQPFPYTPSATNVAFGTYLTPQTGYVGYQAVFSVLAGGPSSISYQWQSDIGNPGTFTNMTDTTLGDGCVVRGSSTSSLTVSNLTLAEQADYQCVVSDSAGSLTYSSGSPGSPNTLTLLNISGLAAINGPQNANLILSGNFLVAEYYGADNGPLPIGGLTFYNNNARLGGGTTISTGNLPYFGATADATNLALISESDLSNPSGIDIVLPTVTGRSYAVQLLFHDNALSALGQRVMNIYAGWHSASLSEIVPNLDLVYFNSYGTNPSDVLVSATLANAPDNNGFEIQISPPVGTPVLSAVTFQDLSAPPVPPVITIEPISSTNIFAGRNLTLNAVVGGTPLNSQWQSDGSVGNTGSFANINNTGNISGATTTTLTITNIGIVQSADYQVVVSNGAGTNTSTYATVQVYPTNTITVGSNYAYAVITNNALDYWRLNETTGTPIVFDSGPGAKDGVSGANLILGQPAPSSPTFPGFEANNSCMSSSPNVQNGYVTTPPLGFTTNTVSMLVWLNPSGANQSGAGIMLSRQGASGTATAGLTYGVTSRSFGDYSLRYFWNGNSADSGLQVPQNIWSLVGLVITPTNSTIYVLNASNISSWSTNVANAVCPFTNPFLIGNDTADNGTGLRTFNGYLDEPAVFTNALSLNQVQSLFAIATGVSELPPGVGVVSPSSPIIVYSGTPVTLISSASGSPLPTTQWMHRPVGLGSYTSVVNGGGYSGAQTTTLTISNATGVNVGDYILVASNNLASATSAVTRLLVIQNNNAHALVGEWFTGTQTLTEMTGLYSGAHDGVVPAGGSVTWSGSVPPSFAGSSLALDGTGSDEVAITNSASGDNDYRLDFDNNITNHFSIAFWAKGFPTANWSPFCTKYGETSPNVGWQVRRNNTSTNIPTFTLRGSQNSGDAAPGASIGIMDNNWHHYCGTYDSIAGQRHLYVDGVDVISLGKDFNGMAPPNGYHMVIGGKENPVGSFGLSFTGNIFDVRFYNYAVQAGEIQAMINPPAAGAIGLYLSSTNPLVVGRVEAFSVIIPNGANSSGTVTVTLTNNAPGVAVIENNITSVTFPMGGPNVQTLYLQAVGPGTISISGGAPGLGSASLVAGAVAGTVVAPGMIGHWLTGAQSLADTSGFVQAQFGAPAGSEDGQASAGTTIGSATAAYVLDAPTAYGGGGGNTSVYALNLTGNYAVTINGSSALGPNYYPTFDSLIDQGFTVSCWAKGIPGSYIPLVSKGGTVATTQGWNLRTYGGNLVPEMTVEGTFDDGSFENTPFSILEYNGIASYATTWHNYVGTWDSASGMRKLYVDGKLVGEMGNDYGPLPPPIDTYMVIGGIDGAEVDNANTTPPTIANYFTGEVFDVRAYNYPIYVSEVQGIVNNSSTAFTAGADTPVIDLGGSGVVSISLPIGANASQSLTAYVTNSNPSAVSINGTTNSTFTITFNQGTYPTELLALTGLADGTATISVGGGPGSTLTPASATVRVCAPQLVGRWFVGLSNVTEFSGFQPAHTHDCVAEQNTTVTSPIFTPINASGNGAAPAGFPGASLSLNGNYGLAVSNTDATASICTTAPNYDPSYQSTFDDVIANHFTITFWENCPSSVGNWAPFVGKGGDQSVGFQFRNYNQSTKKINSVIYGTSQFSSGFISTQANCFNSTWHHIAVTWDGIAGVRMWYVDGVADTSLTVTNDFGPFMMDRHNHLWFAHEENAALAAPMLAPTLNQNADLIGSMYDMRIYNYAMTQTQVQSMQTFQPPTLSAKSLPGGQVQISWSNLYPGYGIQTATSLNPAVWSAPTVAPLLPNGPNGQTYVVTDTPGSSPKYYRLQFVPQ